MSPPEAGELERLLRDSGALLSGHFLLSSGRHSNSYVQCARLLEDPVRARRVGGWLAERLAAHRPETILSPALGGVIVGHETAAALGKTFRFAERREERMELRRGFVIGRGERVAIVEDVVTTGRSTQETAELVEAAGGKWVATGAIIDRTDGAHQFGVPFESLLTLKLESWSAAECPLCLEGPPPIRLGSRDS